MNDDQLIVNNYRFINPGITKNADYDSVVMGSSMIQNFDMDQFRDELGVDPIKLSIGAMSIEGMQLTYEQVISEKKANSIFVAIDIHVLTYVNDDLQTYATYLYDQNILNDMKYLLGYETWMRLLPLNLGLSTLDNVGYSIPNTYATHDIDQLGYWADTAVFDENIIIENYKNNLYGFDLPQATELDQRLKENADQFISIFNSFELKQYTFFFPPYSLLYWHMIEKEGALMSFLNIKTYLINQLSLYSNVTIYDFQMIDEIKNLSLYKGPTHYHPDINHLMVHSFRDQLYIVNETHWNSHEILLSMIREYQIEQQGWL